MELTFPVISCLNDADMRPVAMDEASFLTMIGMNFNVLEVGMVDRFQQIDFPLTTRRIAGIYVRERFLPKGSLLTTREHKTEHPYVISMGRCTVWTERDGVVRLQAPAFGVTVPGTRRLIYAEEDTIWTTFNTCSDDETDEDLEARIVEPYKNPFLKPVLQMSTTESEVTV